MQLRDQSDPVRYYDRAELRNRSFDSAGWSSAVYRLRGGEVKDGAGGKSDTSILSVYDRCFAAADLCSGNQYVAAESADVDEIIHMVSRICL